MVCPRCGRKSSGKICVWCRSGQNLSEYSIRDYNKYSAEIQKEDQAEERITEKIIPEETAREKEILKNTIPGEGEEENPLTEKRDGEPEENQNVRGRSRRKGAAKKSSRSFNRNDRADQKKKKEKEEKDSRIREMQSELQELRTRQKEHERQERERKRQEQQRKRLDKGLLTPRTAEKVEPIRDERAERAEQKIETVVETVTETVVEKKSVKLSTLIVVGFSLLLQLASAVLMALLTVISVFAFWQNREGLGAIQSVLEERNYALALYLAAAGGVIFFGVIWTLWIMSRKGAGGEVRMKTYDTGRGFVPFLLCLGAVYVVVRLAGLVPENGEMWHGMAKAVGVLVTAVQQESRYLMLVSAAGAGLSLIRKILRV